MGNRNRRLRPKTVEQAIRAIHKAQQRATLNSWLVHQIPKKPILITQTDELLLDMCERIVKLEGWVK